MDFYRIYVDGVDKPAAYAARMCEDLGDGYKMFRTGSCAMPCKIWEKISVGDTFTHWQHGELTIQKINRKTMKLTTTDGELVSLLVG